MKILIDYTLAKGHIGGMGVYVKNIVSELIKIDNKNEYHLFENSSPLSVSGKLNKFLAVIKEQIRYQTYIPSLVKRKDADIVFFPNPPVPFFLKTPFILTIADMSFYYDDNMSYITKVYLFIIYFISAHKAASITTFSRYSKKDIQKLLKISPSKIHVIPLAASSKFRPIKDKKFVSKVLNKYDITLPFVVCSPGTFLQRKNVNDLILAYKNLSTVEKQNLQIVLIGKKGGSDYEKTQKLINDLHLTKKVLFTDYMKPESKELISLYTAASLFVYPSLYEGFGLPPLEAMQCHVPVIVYNKTSLPEVVKDAGVLVNDISELTQALKSLLKNKSLRLKLIKKGLKRSRMYSWERSALMFKKCLNTTYDN